MTDKIWREAKPKWVVEAAEEEIAKMARRLALRWPDEARPTPVDFQWGPYDRLEGTPKPGEYFMASYDGNSYPVRIREKTESDPGWKKWLFAGSGERWTDSVVRGPLYLTERDACLAALWSACDKASVDLEKSWEKFTKERGFI